ncbi:MAG TPA: hypothetical protein VFB13_17690 [Reyranella sp.]|jgi:hypothetical protein|nr:hypothetical protein [Reyranella sp.]
MTATLFPDEAVRKEMAAAFMALQAKLEAVSKQMEPLRTVERDLQGEIEALFEKHGVAFAGHCEFCDRLLFAGERGHYDREGAILCEPCAPTYGDWQQQLDGEKLPFDDPDDEADGRAAIAAHLAAGGSLDDKMLDELPEAL